MSYLHDDIDDQAPPHSSNRELTLTTGTVLGIFFGLTLLCALFFGFGYNMGSKSHQAPIATTTTSPTNTTDFSTFKPSPGTPASAPAPKPADTTTTPPASTTTATPPAPIVRTPATIPATTPTTHPAETAPPRTVPANETGITFTVQVAAVSHQEDADLLVAALKRKGYSVNARTEPQDKLIHIQIGPFSSKHDADAMRQRLQGDGYNAIVK
jgi:cell division protein FtsN